MSTLTVIISSPAHNPHRFTLELSRQCSILELKEIITTRLDTKLMIADLRLIFGGRILDDKDTLEHVFEKVDCTVNSPTIHLVVSLPQYTPSPSSVQSTKSVSSTPITTNPLPSVPTQPTTTSGLNPNISHPFTTTTTTTMSHQNPPTSSSMVDGSSSAQFTAAGLSSAFAPAPFAGSPLNQPMQYAVINGMPYLVPAAYLPLLMHQHNLQQALSHYGAYMTNPEGINSFQHAPTAGGTTAGAAAAAPEENAQEILARHERRAASLWLLMKLAFGVYLFSQNGSIERILLLHIAALIIFLQQTGRLRIVRRIGHLPPADNPQAPAPNAGRPANTPAHQNTTTTTTTTTTTSYTSDNNNDSNNPQTRQGDSQQSSSSTNPLDVSTHSGNVGGSNTSSSPQSSSSSSQVTATGASTSATDTLRHRHPQALAQQTQETAEQGQQEPRASTWRSINHALLTFVTSLVPAPPPEIDQAVANAAAAGDRGM